MKFWYNPINWYRQFKEHKMSGYKMVRLVRRLEQKADDLGFMLSYPKHNFGGEYGDHVSIRPKDADSLPVYSRDAEIFTGTLIDLDAFFMGVEWARQYDEMLRLSNTKRRERKEQDERNRQLAATLSQK